MKTLGVFLVSVAVAYVLGAATSSWIIAGNVADLGLEVSFADRLTWIAHDQISMLPLYLPTVLLSLLIGFWVATLIIKRLPNLRTLGYVLAGGLAMFAMHQAVILYTDLHGLPATRTVAGMGLQVLAGMAGGYVFARLGRRVAAPAS